MRYLQGCIILLFMAVVELSVPVPAWSNDLSRASGSNDNVGDVVSVRGSVFVERDQKNIKAKTKLVLLEKDNVFTHEKSRVKILFKDDSILTLGPMSRLVVSQYIYNAEDKRADSIYDLLDGKLRAVVGSPGFKVKTPTAFAAARGTIFLVSYDSKTDATEIAVIEGKVQVKNINPSIGGEQILTRGQMTSVFSGKPPITPKPFNVEMSVDFPIIEMPEIKRPMAQRTDVPDRFVFQPPIKQEPKAKTKTPVQVKLKFPQ